MTLKRKIVKTRWVALMIQLEQQQHGEFVGGVVGWWWVADTNYLYPARWGWINSSLGLDQNISFLVHNCVIKFTYAV